jgi:hypothetical protein
VQSNSPSVNLFSLEQKATKFGGFFIESDVFSNTVARISMYLNERQ